GFTPPAVARTAPLWRLARLRRAAVPAQVGAIAVRRGLVRKAVGRIRPVDRRARDRVGLKRPGVEVPRDRLLVIIVRGLIDEADVIGLEHARADRAPSDTDALARRDAVARTRSEM